MGRHGTLICGICEEIQLFMRLIGTVSDDMKQPDWCPEEDSNKDYNKLILLYLMSLDLPNECPEERLNECPPPVCVRLPHNHLPLNEQFRP
jgi:hypothetical protein